jgi:hypothetical protein
LLGRQLDAFRAAKLPVSAIVVHHDADTSSHAGRAQQVRRWFTRTTLAAAAPLVVCAPTPCLERWLCGALGLDKKVKKANPSAGCAPWKAAWENRRAIDLDRVREAARNVRDRLAGLPDFDAFVTAWDNAGLGSRRLAP